jgi:hypothetical protein
MVNFPAFLNVLNISIKAFPDSAVDSFSLTKLSFILPTVLHYRGYQKKSGCKHIITRLCYHRKKRTEMFTANKIYGKYQTGNDFVPG